MRFLRIISWFSFLKLHSSSLEESTEMLAHFRAMLDHTTKIITTIALLVALSIFKERHPGLIVSLMFYVLWLFFYLYVQRLFEHCIVLLVVKITEADLEKPMPKWCIGLSSFIFGYLIIHFASEYFKELVAIQFLKI